MKAGTVIRIPDTVASKAAGREVVQPGLPGRWSVWSQSDSGPGAHFAVPADAQARETGVKFATVRITEPSGGGNAEGSAPGDRSGERDAQDSAGSLMPREFVNRWAMADALAGDLESACAGRDLTYREIADQMIEAGWRPGGDGD